MRTHNLMNEEKVSVMLGKSRVDMPCKILVLFDSSFQADHSAVMESVATVAQAHGGLVHLFHLTDLNRMPESYNPLAVIDWLGKCKREATSQIEFFRTAISETGINVKSVDRAIGNPSVLLKMKIETLNPSLIMTGQDFLQPEIIDRLMRITHCPLLVIPPVSCAHSEYQHSNQFNKVLEKKLTRW